MSTMASATTENGEVEINTPFHVTGCTREDHDASLPKEKDRSDEGYQGPHDWRKILRPIEDGNLKSPSARLINIFNYEHTMHFVYIIFFLCMILIGDH